MNAVVEFQRTAIINNVLNSNGQYVYPLMAPGSLHSLGASHPGPPEVSNRRLVSWTPVHWRHINDTYEDHMHMCVQSYSCHVTFLCPLSGAPSPLSSLVPELPGS